MAGLVDLLELLLHRKDAKDAKEIITLLPPGCFPRAEDRGEGMQFRLFNYDSLSLSTSLQGRARLLTALMVSLRPLRLCGELFYA